RSASCKGRQATTIPTSGTSSRITMALLDSHTHGYHAGRPGWSSRATTTLKMALRVISVSQKPTSYHRQRRDPGKRAATVLMPRILREPGIAVHPRRPHFVTAPPRFVTSGRTGRVPASKLEVSGPGAPIHEPPTRHRRPARPRLRVVDLLPRRHAVRGRLGLPSQERPCGPVAAIPDAVPQPLAHGAAVHDLRAGGDVHAPTRRTPRAGVEAQHAPAAAAGIRHGRGDSRAAVRGGAVAPPRRAGFRPLPLALLGVGAMAGRCLHRITLRDHMEPPVVSALPVAVHHAAG